MSLSRSRRKRSSWLVAATVYLLLVVMGLPLASQVQVLPTGGGLFTGGAVAGTTDFNGQLNATSVFQVYQNTTHSGNNWIGLSHDGTNGIISAGAGEARLGGFNSFTNGNFLAVGGSGPEIYGSGGTLIAIFNSNGFDISTTGIPNGLTMGSAIGTHDVIWTRDSAATWQAGSDVNGAPVNQTIKAHDGITGTDIKGAGLALKPGLGTGAAVSGSVEQFRDITKATGTTAQTYAQGQIICPSKILSNTSGTLQTIATVTTTSASAGGLSMFLTVTASNGTLVDAETSDANVAWNNNAGTVAAGMGAVLGAVQSNGSGTITAAETVSVATNVVSVRVTPAWTVITPTVVTAYATFITHGVDSIVCQ